MKWLSLHRKDALVISLTFLLPIYVFLYFATSLVQHSLESRDEIDKITPRISRLLGLIDSEQKMQESLLIVSNGSKSLTYPSTEEESVISAALQAELRRMANVSYGTGILFAAPNPTYQDAAMRHKRGV